MRVCWFCHPSAAGSALTPPAMHATRKWNASTQSPLSLSSMHFMHAPRTAPTHASSSCTAAAARRTAAMLDVSEYVPEELPDAASPCMETCAGMTALWLLYKSVHACCTSTPEHTRYSTIRSITNCGTSHAFASLSWGRSCAAGRAAGHAVSLGSCCNACCR
jgi:hypothetical protein